MRFLVPLFILGLIATIATFSLSQPRGGGGGAVPAETLPTTCANNEILKSNGSGQLVCSADLSGGGGTANILDLGDDMVNESADLVEIATTGDTNSIFTESAADKLLINVGLNWPTADAADALSANGGNCAAGNFPLGVDTLGAVEGCTDAATQTELNTHVSDITDVHGINIATPADAHLLLYDGVTDNRFENKAMSGDVTITAAGVTTVANDSHTHVSANISDKDAGTDLTADLEEETHASEHLENGADEILAENLGTACTNKQVLQADATGGLVCAVDGRMVQSPTTLALADATPPVSTANNYYDCSDTTTYTDFVDTDGDHSEFTVDFTIYITAQAACGLAFSGGTLQGNGGADWTATIGDVAQCNFSTTGDNWTCFVSSPNAINTVVEETSAILAPNTASIDWIRLSGDAGAPAMGSNGTSILMDIDNDQSADCTFSKSGGVVTIDCNNTNVTLQPGQTSGDIKFNDSAGTECLELDPDTGAMTQGTNCGDLIFDDVVASYVSHSLDTATIVTLSGVECHGYSANNDAGAIEFDLCDATKAGLIKCFEDRAGGAITVDPPAGDVISEADGTALAAGEAIILASGIGNGFCIMSDSATTWHVLPGAVGALTQETP